MKLDNVPPIIYASFVLHNFCGQNDMRMDNDLVQRQVEHDKEVQPEIAPDRIFSYNSSDGEPCKGSLHSKCAIRQGTLNRALSTPQGRGSVAGDPPQIIKVLDYYFSTSIPSSSNHCL
ncbi:hypothetical protein P5673_025775 [Acropora cervicornis]|uniref:Uncharacterized protein n=1 Tax=Acropora cervicornis TaxID=6130 RepID=A0AAD9Q1H5_ACRCE|nr:hypothetical protein P5673_025775 [Acropora cervicornis]